MKFFIDTEFIEGWKKPISWLPSGRYNKPYHSIQLISIGIIDEKDRTYYAISNEFNSKDADNWVKENVISKLPESTSPLWKSNKQIAEEIKEFVYKGCETSKDVDTWGKDNPIEFYAYYADYDWVVFCSLFGTMVDLPDGFPMYCLDIQQMIHNIQYSGEERIYHGKTKNDFTYTWKLEEHPNYPKQVNEHNALSDATWNKKLYEFLKIL